VHVKTVTAVWLLLVLASGFSWAFGHGFGFGDRYRYASVAVVLIAFIKVRFVFLDFMELRRAPWSLRLIFESWALSVCGAIIVLYLMGRGKFGTSI
jgi:hypothetical protein